MAFTATNLHGEDVPWLRQLVASLLSFRSGINHSPCRICDRQKWPWDRLFARYLALPCHCLSTNASYLYCMYLLLKLC